MEKRLAIPEGELTALRHLGKRFAERSPALAPFLGQSGRDPDVERESSLDRPALDGLLVTRPVPTPLLARAGDGCGTLRA